MKKTAFCILALLSIPVVVFLLGPRVPIDTELHELHLANDLEAYLATSELRFDDIVPGAEKTIIWANPSKSKTALSIVYLHGFSATRQETAPLCDNIASRLGANLFYTRYTGHGRTGPAMAEPTVNDWLNDTMEALEIGKRLGDKVIVVATSTGGTLATWLAQQPQARDVLCFVLLAPNFALFNSSSELLTLPWGNQIARLFVGKEYAYQPVNEEHAKYWTCRYPSSSLVTMMGLVKFVRSSDLQSIQTPVQVIYSPRDTVVDHKETEDALSRFGSNTKVLHPVTEWVNEGNHLLAGDIRAPDHTQQIAEEILQFIYSVQ